MSRTTWWRGTGRRRAADRIPALVDGRNQLLTLGWWQAQRLADLQRQNAKLTAANELLASRLEGLLIEHKSNLGAYDELAARYAEITAIRVPAPADQQAAIPEPDLETTREMTIPAVWAMDGLRTPVPLWDKDAA